MHIFVYEYLSSGAARDAAELPSLQTEGWAMLSAVLEDLTRCSGVQLSTLVDSRRTLPSRWSKRITVQRVQSMDEEDVFRELAAAADWSLVIAPEFDRILAQHSRWVEEASGRLLGSSPQAIDATADKLLLSRLWTDRAIPTPQPERSYPLMCKPRFGAGSQATFLVQNESDLDLAVKQAGEEGWNGELMFQEYTPGLAVSVAFLSGQRRRNSLPAVEQRLSADGRFRYLGGRLPLPAHLDRRARRLADRAVDCIEGLHGWFGVDLVLGAAADGSEDVAIEINPRLTTSYLGLRRLARFNLAEAWIATVTGSSTPCRQWGTDSLVFDVQGSIDRSILEQ